MSKQAKLVVFSQLFWVLNFCFLAKYEKYNERKYLWWLTFGAAFAFLTKYDAVFLFKDRIFE